MQASWQELGWLWEAIEERSANRMPSGISPLGASVNAPSISHRKPLQSFLACIATVLL